MAQSIVGLENVQPYKFSECSKNDYIDLLRLSHGGCMMNKPNEVSIFKVDAWNFFLYHRLKSKQSAGEEVKVPINCTLHNFQMPLEMLLNTVCSSVPMEFSLSLLAIRFFF